MACATCDHTMQKVSDPAWWCPRCGTIKDHVQQQPTDRERIAELERKCARQLEALSKVPKEAAKAVKQGRAEEREGCIQEVAEVADEYGAESTERGALIWAMNNIRARGDE